MVQKSTIVPLYHCPTVCRSRLGVCFQARASVYGSTHSRAYIWWMVSLWLRPITDTKPKCDAGTLRNLLLVSSSSSSAHLLMLKSICWCLIKYSYISYAVCLKLMDFLFHRFFLTEIDVWICDTHQFFLCCCSAIFGWCQ